ncbi:MAG: carboxypeptidase-like regulatory domain-containing protein [Gemmataceae bacterium]
MQRPVRLIAVSVLVSVVAGCGGGGGRDYKIKADQQATITGTVKFGNANLPVKAMVTFFNPDQGIAAIGFIDESGKFTLKPAERETGLPAGTYLVTVTPPPPPPMTEEQYKKMEANAMAMPQMTYKELPAKFYNSMTSGLVFEVTPGANHFEIDLAKK